MNRRSHVSSMVGRKGWGGALSTLLTTVCVSDAVEAQTSPYPGQWAPGFNHQVSPHPDATNHLVPFPGSTLFTADFDAPFNAIHMSLIPRGKDRGKVIVWDSRKYVMQPNGSYAGGGQPWSFQCWSIVDPAVNLTGPRFQNFLLPVHPIVITPAPEDWVVEALFCAGHCWSPYGDLIVAGGDSNGTQGTAIVMLYRPDEAGQAWPQLLGNAWTNDFTGPALYGGAHGKWIYGPALRDRRYYPTVTLTSRLGRTLGREVALVTGGSVVVGGDHTLNPTWNTYEGLRIFDPVIGTVPQGLQPDFVNTPLGSVFTFTGPDDGIAPNSFEVAFGEYPRMHWLTSAEVFMSGYEPVSARTQHESPPLNPSSWDYSNGYTSLGALSPPASWVFRHDGASVFFARYGDNTNVVQRIGGFTGAPGSYPPTRTTEAIYDAAGAPGTTWKEGENLVHARGWLNAVVLPDASVLAIGGLDGSPQGLTVAREAELFKDGQWGLLPFQNTLRVYHATAVLLPDGRVLVGGGEERHLHGPPAFDYEVYSPWYMSRPRPSIVSMSQSPNLGSNPDGSVRVAYGSPLTVNLTLPKQVGMGKVVLMAPGSMTHHSDMHARYIELELEEGGFDLSGGMSTGTYSMPTEAMAPRGYYMVFVVTAGGVPSQAGWLQIVN